MRIKRFVAPDMRQALRRIREELGAEAVILASQKLGDGIEVTAAIDQDEPARPGSKPSAALPFGEATPVPIPHAADAGAGASRPAQPAGWDKVIARDERIAAMGDELRGLRQLLEAQVAELAQAEFARRHPRRRDLVQRLVALGLVHALARELAEEVPEPLEAGPAWRCVLERLAARLPVTAQDVSERGGVIALLGPTGVGKTTTIAKIAARHVLRHGPDGIALVTTDSYRVGAHEQLRAFGRIMGIPVRVADDEQALRQSLAQFCDRRLVLIDTAGISQRDVRFAGQLAMLRRGAPSPGAYLVLSAASQWLMLEETVRAFTGSRINGCIITKTDESTSLGAVLSLVSRHRLPVAYVSGGQRVPEDLELASPGRLVALATVIALEAERRLQATGGEAGLEERLADAQF